MAFMAQFVRGEDVLTMNHIAGANIEAGDVVIVGGLVGIATRPILSGKLGGLNISGGTYKVKGDAAIAAGVDVYWVVASGKVTATAGANKYFGTTVSACSGDGVLFEVAHKIPKTV